MPVTNKDLDEKMDKVYTRINKVLDLANENAKNIAILVKQTETQNGRIGKCEGSINGIEGSVRDVEAEITEIAGKQNDCLKRQEKKSGMRWDREMVKFGGLVSLVTSGITGIIFLIARFFLGI